METSASADLAWQEDVEVGGAEGKVESSLPW